MSEETTREILSNVDLDLTGTEMRRPLIDKQPVRSIIKGCFFEAAKDGNGQVKKNEAGQPMVQLVVQLSTLSPALTTTGKTIEAGHETEVIIGATPKGKRTQLMINQQIGRVQMAALGVDESGLTKFVPEQMVGRVVLPTYEVEMGRKQDSSGNWSDDPEKLYQRVSRWEKVS